MKRRAFNNLLCSWLGVTAIGAAPMCLAERDKQQEQWFASAAGEGNGIYSVVVFNKKGEERFRHRLLSRAHQVMKHPSKSLLFVVDRRPGRYLDVLDSESGELLTRIEPQVGQDFCGHLQFSLDGRYLLTTESLSMSSEGLIVFRDITQNFAVVQSVSSGGIGPHQLIINERDNTIIVANGGIHEQQREKLNLAQMRSNLSYLDADSGMLLESQSLDAQYFQTSIRHIDAQADVVLLAMQHQGAMTEQVPLVAVHRRGSPIEVLTIADAEYFQLHQYCGSACLDETGQTAAVSAPRGDRILFWDLATKGFLASVKINDGCGIARANKAGRFIVSSGRGRVYYIDPRSGEKQKLSDKAGLQWDNHLALT